MDNTEQTPFISMIMPVYNAEKYIRKAIDSVIAQTYQNFELLLIDDCSPDGSGAICDEYAKNFTGKIKVFHLEKNGGASNARNVAIDNACGDYVSFMDSDDTIENNLFEKAVSAINEYNATTVIFGMTEDYYDAKGDLKYSIQILPERSVFLSNHKMLCEEIIHLEERTLYGYTCDKVYDLKRIQREHIYYENIKLHEDTLFNIAYFMDAENAYIYALAPYHYGKRIENSITSQFIPEYYDIHMKKIQKIYDQHVYWHICTPEVKRILGNIYIRYTLSALQRNCDPRAEMDHKTRKHWLRNLYNSELYVKLIDFAHPENKSLKYFAILFRKKSVSMCLFYGRIVYIIKNKMPILFAKLKQKN